MDRNPTPTESYAIGRAIGLLEKWGYTVKEPEKPHTPPRPDGYYQFDGRWWEADRYGNVAITDVVAGEDTGAQLEDPVCLHSGDGYEPTDKRWLMRPVTPPVTPTGWCIVGWGVPTRENCDGWLELPVNPCGDWANVVFTFDTHIATTARWLLRREKSAEPQVSDHDALVALCCLHATQPMPPNHAIAINRYIRQQEGK